MLKIVHTVIAKTHLKHNFSQKLCLLSVNTSVSDHFNMSRNMSLDKKEQFTKISEKLRKKDGVSQNYELVYRTTLESYINPTRYFGQGTLITAFSVLPIGLLGKKSSVLGVGNFILTQSFELWGFWFFILAHALACLKICNSVPVRIYFCKSEDNFLFVFNDIFHFSKMKKFSVEPGNIVQSSTKNNYFKLDHLRHITIDRKTVFIHQHFFMTPFYYNKLLGINYEEKDDSKDYKKYA